MIILRFIVLILGIASSYTDIKYRVIKNGHLLLALFLGFVAYVFLALKGVFIVDRMFFVNLLVGLIIGFLFYWINLWAAGDAKLFFLYSFLIPYSKYSRSLSLPSLALFANVLLVSFITIGVLYIVEILGSKQKLVLNLSFRYIFRRFIRTFLIIFSFGWIVSIVFRYVPFKLPPILAIMVFYLFIFSAQNLLMRFKKRRNRLIVLFIAMSLHFFFLSEDFYLASLSMYSRRIALFTIVFLLINLATKKEKEESNRVPFAPIMLIGAVTLESSLIGWVMNIYRILPL